MAGERRDDRHAQLLPVEEPRRLRRRRHDASRRTTRSPSGSSGFACTAARSSTSTTKSATTAASTRCRPRCCSAKLPHLDGVERQAPRERRVLRRGLRGPRRTCSTPYVEPGQRLDLQPVHDSRCRAATLCRPSSRSGGSARRSTTRCRCTCSHASRTWATRKGSVRRAERAAARGTVLADLPRARREPSSTKSSPPYAPSTDADAPRHPIVQLSTVMKAELLSRIQDRTATVGVVGLGYVGLPLAMEFAKAGFHVIGYDVSERRVQAAHERRVAHPGRSGGRSRVHAQEAGCSRRRPTKARSAAATRSRSRCRRRSARRAIRT